MLGKKVTQGLLRGLPHYHGKENQQEQAWPSQTGQK
jgi:hypothetical protein